MRHINDNDTLANENDIEDGFIVLIIPFLVLSFIIAIFAFDFITIIYKLWEIKNG